MRVAYFDPFCGLSGEAILGALLDVGVPLDALQAELHKLAVQGPAIQVAKSMQGGILGTSVVLSSTTLVEEGIGQLPGRASKCSQSLRRNSEMDADAMVQIIARSELVPSVKKASISVVRMIGIALIQPGWEQEDATGELWSVNTLTQIVGTMSSLNILGIDRVECGSIATNGSDPAARDFDALGVELLLRTPGACAHHKAYSGGITLTGVCMMLLIASRFGSMPPMRIDKVGYGASSTLARDSILRAIVGKVGNVDNMTAEMPALPGPIANSPEPCANLAIGIHQQSGRHVFGRSGERGVRSGLITTIL